MTHDIEEEEEDDDEEEEKEEEEERRANQWMGDGLLFRLLRSFSSSSLRCRSTSGRSLYRRRGRLDSKECIHTFLLTLFLRLYQTLNVGVHTIRVKTLIIDKEGNESFAINLREFDGDGLAIGYFWLLEQATSLLIRPVIGHLVMSC